MSRCPEPATLHAFTQGTLSAPEGEALEAHLEGCASCRGALSALVELEAPSLATPSVPGRPRAVLAAGTRVGRYRVESLAGAGGMGVIYAANDPTLARRVALKLVSPRHGEAFAAAAAERLLLEAQAMAKLSHPNVLPVFDAGAFGEQALHRHGVGRRAHARRLAARA